VFISEELESVLDVVGGESLFPNVDVGGRGWHGLSSRS
jgi:hypothetical protein